MNITDLRINIDNLKFDINLHKNNCSLCIKEERCTTLLSYYEDLNNMINNLNTHKIKYLNYKNKFNYETKNEQTQTEEIQKIKK